MIFDTKALGRMVEDGLVAATNPLEVQELIKMFKNEFKITVKSGTYFLGIEIEQRINAIKIHHQAYTIRILERFKMELCRPIGTPIVKES